MGEEWQGVLYVVATPIGNLSDWSQRARSVLAEATLILAEDTRHTAHLLAHYGVETPMQALHEHNESAQVASVVERIRSGQRVALVSDAGTPLISDPGYRVVRAVLQAGLKVSPIPGASAMVAALSVAGLASDRFFFEGFLPARAQARQQRLQALSTLSCTLVFYEAPHRLLETMEAMLETLGNREATLCRELTKLFETVHHRPLVELRDWVQADSMQQRGEMVLLVAGATTDQSALAEAEDRRVLHLLLQQLPLRQAVDLAVALRGGRKKWFYTEALQHLQDLENQG